jgi:hypothetical protein
VLQNIYLRYEDERENLALLSLTVRISNVPAISNSSALSKTYINLR